VFESALGRSEVAPGRLGTGAILSIGAHALVVGAVLFFSGTKAPARTETPMGPIVLLNPPPLLGTPGGPAKQVTPKTTKRPRPNPKIVPIPPKEPPKTDPTEPEPPADTSSESTDNQEGPGNGGQPDGDPNGKIGGTGPVTNTPPPPEPPPTNTTLLWTADMERPALLSGPSQPPYPREAMAMRAEGIVVAQCVITTEGTLQSCRIIKGHPLLDPAVHATLAQQRYRPVMYGGKPVSVRYVLTFKFKLQ
jgi:periplasmic protein TonB